MSASRGRLLVVGTPIGNLGDLSPRAAEALRAADLVVAEDTRVAARLLAHLDARRPTRSFNEHNAATRLPELLARLAAGETLALTTDAGMPGVSDPGAALVAAARSAGASVEVVPGPTAVTAAVALAGQEATGFVFGGFLPARPASAREAALERLLAAAGSTGLLLVLYEAPQRMRDLLERLGSRAPEARLAVGRELTKRFEEMVTGSPAEVASRIAEPRGEFTVVVSNVPAAEVASAGLDSRGVVAAASREGLSHRTVTNLLRGGGLARREAYALAGSAGATADDRSLDVLEALERLELALARRDPSLAGEPLPDLLDPEFTEFGASGRKWDRGAIAELLSSAEPRQVELRDFRVWPLGSDAAVATYLSVEADGEAERAVHRSSIWLADGGRWRIRFHQGTPVSPQ